MTIDVVQKYKKFLIKTTKMITNCELIHSHNTMDVFFSGTDWSELEDNSHNHNFYLSLIVNNFMDFTAKVGFVTEAVGIQKFDFTAKDENGEKYVFNSKDYTIKNKKFIVYDCNIISPLSEIIISDNFKEKVKTIIENSEKKTKTTIYQGNTFGNSWNTNGYLIPNIEEEDILEDSIEEFTMFVLNMGNDTKDYGNITDIIKNYKKYNINGKVLLKGVLDKYVQLYEKFFDQLYDKDDPSMFTYITEQVIIILEDEKVFSTSKEIREMLTPTIKGLTEMLYNFKKYEKTQI